MIRRNPVMTGVVILAILVALDLLLVVSGHRVLIGESYEPAREASSGLSFFVPAAEAEFRCTYFTGRKRVHKTLPAAQYDECPFIMNADQMAGLSNT